MSQWVLSVQLKQQLIFITEASTLKVNAFWKFIIIVLISTSPFIAICLNHFSLDYGLLVCFKLLIEKPATIVAKDNPSES